MTVEAIQFTTADNMTLRGQYHSGSENLVLLLHDVGEDLDCWHPLLPRLVSRGYSLLTFDLRAHGASDGEWNLADAETDFAAMLDYARQKNPKNLFLITTGISGTIALKLATDATVRGAVFISPGLSETVSADMRGRGMAKLFIVGAQDDEVRQKTLQLRNQSIGWSLVVNLPTAENGSVLLRSQWQLHIQEHITAFLHEQCHTSSQMPRPTGLSIEQLLHRPDQK